MTFTVSDQYTGGGAVPDLPLISSTAPPTIGADGSQEGEVYHFASTPFVNGTLPGGTPTGAGWPTAAIKDVAAWEFSIDDPNSLDPFFATPDQVFDFSWTWTLFADDTDPNAGGVPSTFSINKTGKFSDLFPPAGGWVEVEIEIGGGTIDAFAIVGVDAPVTPSLFEIGYVILATETDLTPFFPPGTPDGSDAFIVGGTGNLQASPVADGVPEPLTASLAGLAGAALTASITRRRRPV